MERKDTSILATDDYNCSTQSPDRAPKFLLSSLPEEIVDTGSEGSVDRTVLANLLSGSFHGRVYSRSIRPGKPWLASLVLVIPAVLVLAVIALPFLDRGVERRPWKRPVAMGAYAFVLFALVGLGLRSQYVDKHDAGVAQQLAKQRSEEEEYMRKPFEPELSSGSLAAANVALADPLSAKGKTIFEAQSCNACHGDGGVGTAAAPPLVGIAAKVPAAQLAQFFQHPTSKMVAGGMLPIDLPPDALKALVAYVESLK